MDEPDKRAVSKHKLLVDTFLDYATAVNHQDAIEGLLGRKRWAIAFDLYSIVQSALKLPFHTPDRLLYRYETFDRYSSDSILRVAADRSMWPNTTATATPMTANNGMKIRGSRCTIGEASRGRIA